MKGYHIRVILLKMIHYNCVYFTSAIRRRPSDPMNAAHLVSFLELSQVLNIHQRNNWSLIVDNQSPSYRHQTPNAGHCYHGEEQQASHGKQAKSIKGRFSNSWSQLPHLIQICSSLTCVYFRFPFQPWQCCLLCPPVLNTLWYVHVYQPLELLCGFSLNSESQCCFRSPVRLGW